DPRDRLEISGRSFIYRGVPHASSPSFWCRSISTVSSSANDPVQPPHTGHTLEHVLPEVFEPERGTRYQVLHCGGGEDLGRCRERGDPRADVHGDSQHTLVGEYDLPSVDPSLDLQPYLRHRLAGPDAAP